MATNLKEFIKVISENFELGEDFDFDQIPEVELPEQFNDKFHQNFLTPLSAKNNAEIRGHFKAQYLSTVDSRIKAGFLANGGTQEAFTELKAQEPDSMKLIDLVLNESVKLKSNSNAPLDDSKHEAYKIKTSKQISELLAEKEGFEDKFKTAIDENNGQWNNRLQTATINSKLASKSFNDALSREDSIHLTMKNIDSSPYLLKLDANLNEKVYDRANPDNEAILDGKNVTWDNVVDIYSQPYTKKNDQNPNPTPVRTVIAPVATATTENGKYIVGHADYGK